MQVLYIALPAILDTNPFQDVDDESEKKPQEVETVINIFQTTYNVVKTHLVHDDIIHQLFAYLFFFTNASLFNTLMERGGGGKFYRWAKGAQIRGNLDLLESWAAQVQLQDEANEYLSILSTAADLLATPKVQLLQVGMGRTCSLWWNSNLRSNLFHFSDTYMFLGDISFERLSSSLRFPKLRGLAFSHSVTCDWGVEIIVSMLDQPSKERQAL